VAQVVSQGDRFDQVFIQAQGTRNRAAQLCDLQRVRHAGAKQIALVVQENLGFVDQSSESGRVDDAIAVTLVRVAKARGMRWGIGLCMSSTPRLRGPRSEGG
jgi:hypothetical protein